MSDITRRLCCYCGNPIGGGDIYTVHGFTVHPGCARHVIANNVETVTRLAGIALTLVAGAQVTFHHAHGNVMAYRHLDRTSYSVVSPAYTCSDPTPWGAAVEVDRMLEALAHPVQEIVP